MHTVSPMTNEETETASAMISAAMRKDGVDDAADDAADVSVAEAAESDEAEAEAAEPSQDESPSSPASHLSTNKQDDDATNHETDDEEEADDEEEEDDEDMTADDAAKYEADDEDDEEEEDDRVDIDPLLFRGLDTQPLLALLQQPHSDAFYEGQTDMWGDIEASARDFLTQHPTLADTHLVVLNQVAGVLDQVRWPQHQVLLGNAMDFVFAQPDDFVAAYLQSWLDNACRGDGPECAAQTVEQMVWSIRDALASSASASASSASSMQALRAALPVEQKPVLESSALSVSASTDAATAEQKGGGGGRFTRARRSRAGRMRKTRRG